MERAFGCFGHDRLGHVIALSIWARSRVWRCVCYERRAGEKEGQCQRFDERHLESNECGRLQRPDG